MAEYEVLNFQIELHLCKPSCYCLGTGTHYRVLHKVFTMNIVIGTLPDQTYNCKCVENANPTMEGAHFPCTLPRKLLTFCKPYPGNLKVLIVRDMYAESDRPEIFQHF